MKTRQLLLFSFVPAEIKSASKTSGDCYICLRRISNPRALVRHIAAVHFSKELTQTNQGFDLRCAICGDEKSQTQELFFHLAKYHDKLKDHVPDWAYDNLVKIGGLSGGGGDLQ